MTLSEAEPLERVGRAATWSDPHFSRLAECRLGRTRGRSQTQSGGCAWHYSLSCYLREKGEVIGGF